MNMQEFIVEVLNARRRFAWVPGWDVERIINGSVVRGRTQDSYSPIAHENK